MRTFSTLYNNKLTGVFPEVKAKSASTVTAKDGTPFKAINIDDTSWGWIQALLDFVGQTPDGVAETYDQSQIFNAMREAFSTARKQTIAASGPVVFGKTNQEVEVDLSLGNLSIDQLPVPDFIGQKVHIYGVGSGIGSIAGGTGLYVNGVFFTENTGGVFLTAISLTEWRAENGVTADYVSSSAIVHKCTDGRMEESIRFSKNNGVTDAQVWTYPVVFIGTVISTCIRSDANTPVLASIANTPSNTQIPIVVQNNTLSSVTTSIIADLTIKGKY